MNRNLEVGKIEHLLKNVYPKHHFMTYEFCCPAIVDFKYDYESIRFYFVFFFNYLQAKCVLKKIIEFFFHFQIFSNFAI